MNKKISQFLIAAPHSGSGKTTVTLGLLAALRRRGYRVQPYKCGPDYIDTKFHAAASGTPSVNLDTFMASSVHVRDLYIRYAAQADICVVEGMMGLFDGYDRQQGSSSEVAALLRLPVILVVDAASTSYSVAALLQGFMHFRADTYIAGVLLNRVGSEHHYRLLQEACQEVGLPCLGYLPKDRLLEQGSRYLGLDFSRGVTSETQEHLIGLVEQHVDISRLLQLTSRPLPCVETSSLPSLSHPMHSVVLRDAEAFSFLYTEHLDVLHRLGAVTYLNPLDDKALPEDTDFLYLPGGYPEKHAEDLSRARQTNRSIRCYLQRGGRALAECGGMIYLSQGIHYDEAPEFVPLVGVLPFSISCQQAHRKLQLGYRQFAYQGQMIRGHEFHYTSFVPGEELPASVAPVYNARRMPVSTPVFRYKNLLASYTHLYWGETIPQLMTQDL